MWVLKNPWKAFEYVTKQDKTKTFDFCAIINTEKYYTFPKYEELESLAKENKSLLISDICIKDPNNTANLVNAKMIRFSI